MSGPSAVPENSAEGQRHKLSHAETNPTHDRGPSSSHVGVDGSVPVAAAACGVVERGGADPASGEAAPPSVAAASDVSRLSGDSQQWTSAVTVAPSHGPNASTLGYEATLNPAEPAVPLQEEAGSNSGPATPTTAPGSSTCDPGAAPSEAEAGVGGGAVPVPPEVPWLQRAEAAAAAAAAAAAGGAAAAGAATASSNAEGGGLPPRLIVFHPDGTSFGIGVDKSREAQLAAASIATARQGSGQGRRMTAVGSSRTVSNRTAEDSVADSRFAGYRQIYRRQKIALILLLLLDAIYLFTLLIIRVDWGKDETIPKLNTVAKFFIGSHPNTTSISFLGGSLFTDTIALYGTTQDFASVITLFIVWSVVLGAFAVLEMPLCFMILRLLLIIAAFQLRFSMARIRHMLPPASFGGWLAAASRGGAAVGGATWRVASHPFRSLAQRRRQAAQQQQQQQQQAQAQEDGHVAAGSAPAPFPPSHWQLPGVAGPGAVPAVPRQPVGAAAAQLAAARSSTLYRAALMRLITERLRHQAGQRDGDPAGLDLEAGTPSSDANAAAGSMPASLNGRGAERGGTVSSGGRQQQQGSNLDQLYGRMMDDIAAVASTPSGRGINASGSSERRLARHQRERNSQRTAVSGSGAGDGSSAAAQAMSAGANAAEPSAGAGNSTASGGVPAPEPAEDRAASLARRIAARSRGSTPTLQELVMLLSYHSERQQAQQQQAQQAQQPVNVVPMVSMDAPPPL